MGKKPPMDGDGVGYGKPPKHSQFKPGQSGNPSGKKKKTKKLKDMFLDEALREVKIRQSGDETYVSIIILVLRAALAKAAKGDNRAIAMVLKYYENAEYLLDDRYRNFSWDEEAAKLAVKMEKLAKAAMEKDDDDDGTKL